MSLGKRVELLDGTLLICMANNEDFLVSWRVIILLSRLGAFEMLLLRVFCCLREIKSLRASSVMSKSLTVVAPISSL